MRKLNKIQSVSPSNFVKSKRLTYQFIQDPRFRVQFPKRIDLQFALLLPSNLIYSSSVKKALRFNKCRHVTNNRGRCAAFALGSSQFYQSEHHWYIFTLQSDLAFSHSSVLRDCLRGWRLALINSILKLAMEVGVSAIFLAPSMAVYRSVSFWRFKLNPNPPISWINIYDRTAMDLDMKLVSVPNPINIQVMPRCRAYPNSEFYKLNMNMFEMNKILVPEFFE